MVNGKLAIIKSQNFKHAVKSNIGYSKARKLAFAPHINIGVFSMEANSPGWASWQKNLNQTLKGSNYLIKEFPNEENYNDAKDKVQEL